MDVDLETVETTELLAELEGRFDNFIFTGTKKLTGGGHYMRHAKYHGDELSAMGLCAYLSRRISDDFEEDSEPVGDDEDEED